MSRHISKKSSFGSEAWTILSDIEQRIKCKVEFIGVPLKEWDIEIYRGILTGCNDAFIITSEKRDEILNNRIMEEERRRIGLFHNYTLLGANIMFYVLSTLFGYKNYAKAFNYIL